MSQKKRTMSREDVKELYQDLQKAMSMLKGKRVQPRPSSPQNLRLDTAASESISASRLEANREQFIGMARERMQGSYLAIALVVIFASLKVGIAILETIGFASVKEAQASYIPPARPVALNQPTFSKEEIKVLSALDARRVELEERGNRLDEREQDLDRRDREYASKLTKLRELTDNLKQERSKGDKKQEAQLEQLANVYGSMNPPEAAALIEQLDATIALALIEKMPEKRIAQILGAMNPQKALLITKMLSGKMNK